MSAARVRLVHWALYLLAAAWPWDAFQVIPFLFLPLTVAASAALAGVGILEVIRTGRWRVPFELTWPVVGLIAAAGVSALTARSGAAIAVAGQGLCFLAVFHHARARETVVRCLWISCLSAGMLALLNLLAPWLGVFPTAFASDSSAAFAGPRTLPGGVWIFLYGAVTSILLCRNDSIKGESRIPWSAAACCRFHRRSDVSRQSDPKRQQAAALHRIQRAALAAGAMSSILLLVRGPALLAGFPYWEPAHLRSLPFLTFIILGLLVWLVARVGAKLTVSRIEDAPGISLPLLAMVAILTGAALVWPPEPALGQAFVLALAASYAQPSTRSFSSRPVSWLVGVPVAMVAVANLCFVSPNNPWDPRNYTFGAARLLAEAPDALEDRLQAVERLAPEERRTHLWRARLRLSQGDADGAAAAFAEAVRPGEPRLLPAPGTQEIDEMLAQLRDACSALPEDRRGLAYERALLAAGQRVNALALLRLRARGGAADNGRERRPLALTLAGMLGDPSLVEELIQWETGELLRVLETLGAPAGVP
jgi:hypothetical protein